MTDRSAEFDSLLARASQGEQQAVAALFDQYRDRLRRMVRLRLDRRVQGRISASDVLQEAYLDLARRIHEYTKLANYPFFLWLRQLVGQRLIDVHRQHLGAQMRSAELEVQLPSGVVPTVSAESFAGLMVDHLGSASQQAELNELQQHVRDALQKLDASDREILAMRHFEMLTNSDCAKVLGMTSGAASKRYVRALRRVRETLEAHPGFPDLFTLS